MSDIPEDIMKAAAAILHQYENEPDDQIIVARAMMVERDRCFAIRPDPDITTEEPDKPYTSGYVEGFWDAVARYRAAIRSPRP